MAVNTAAVLAALLGVASGLAIFSPLLLVIPGIAVIVSVIAWRQIANSNGTETGKPLAAERARNLNAHHAALSITHTSSLAMASVVLEDGAGV